jgi:hypothetical protein
VGVPPVSEIERGEGGTGSVFWLDGPWAPFPIWAEGFPEVRFIFFFLFSFFLFYFLYFFITFAFDTQMTSNQFVKFSKIPSNIPEQ